MKKYLPIFDYKDLFYNDEDPLLFLIRKSIFQTLRRSYYMLDNKTKHIIKSTIILEENTLDNYNEQEYKKAINILHNIFTKNYLGGKND